MDIELSDEALAEYERIERDEPDRHALLVDDLTMLAATAPVNIERWTSIAGIDYVLGPTGRVRYWVVIEGERLVVEYFDLDP